MAQLWKVRDHVTHVDGLKPGDYVTVVELLGDVDVKVVLAGERGGPFGPLKLFYDLDSTDAVQGLGDAGREVLDLEGRLGRRDKKQYVCWRAIVNAR